MITSQSAMRNQGVGFAGKAGLHSARDKLKGERALAAGMAKSLTNQIARLAHPDIIEQLVVAAARFVSGRHVHDLAVRLCHAVDWQIYCVLLPLSGHRDVLKAIAPIGQHPLRFASFKDVLFALDGTCNKRGTIKGTQYAAQPGVPTVTQRASVVSSRPRRVGHSVLVPNDGASFFLRLTRAFVVGKISATMIPSLGGSNRSRTLVTRFASRLLLTIAPRSLRLTQTRVSICDSVDLCR
jgi:hypothetical protein